MRMNPWAIAIIVMAFLGGQSAASTEPIPTTVPRQERGQSSLSYDGRIEATRTTRVTAQVKGPLIGLEVASGDRVTRGQILARVETQAAEAAVRVNRALTEATREALIQLETQREQHRRLNPLDDPSRTPAAVAQAQFTAIMAELDAYVVKDQQLRAYLALHQIQSPDDGVVAETFVALGDHVKPGTPLLSLFDPHALRLTVAVPSILNARPTHAGGVRIELPTQTPDKRWIKPARTQVLPAPDGSPHTSLWQFDLPAYAGDARPGMTARVWLPQTSEAAPGVRLFIPASAVVQRMDRMVVYVMDPYGRPQPRFVTVGPANTPSELEVFGGLGPQERIATQARTAEGKL